MSSNEILKDSNNSKFSSKDIEQNKNKIEENDQYQKIKIIPFKSVFLKIFKGSSYYLLDRHKYDINTIMMLLDLNKINKLSEIFKEFDEEEGIEKTVFVEKMKGELPCNLTDPMDETNLVYGLYKFFCEVDFNGDGHMQWKEFTQFIIDTVEGDNEAKVNEKEEDNTNKIFSEKQMLKYKRYHVSVKIRDNLIHKSDVISAVFIPRIEMIVFAEYNHKFVKIYSARTGRSIKNLYLDDYLNPKTCVDSDNKFSKKKRGIFDEKLSLKKKSKNEDKTARNLNYSVLYMTNYHNLIAICLSDKRIVFFHYASEDRIEFIHEVQTKSLEKRIWYLPVHNLWVSSGCRLENYSYYTLNELDIDFLYNNQKIECLFNEGHPFLKHYCDICPHKGEIMDCIEITKPMMVLTACLDAKIRLINAADKSLVKVWINHSLGVRSLDYNPLIENVGYILSVGFEYFINLYCTDLSIEEAYKGKLEGHYAPVISAKFLSNSYMAVSVDEEAFVRIWDTRLKICLQVIASPKKNFRVTNLLSLAKFNKFLVYGNKIIYYDAKYKEEEKSDKSQIKEDNYPLRVEFNNYYQQFFVITLKDIRVYDKDGNLYKVYRKITNNEHFETEAKIRYFIFENNHRKFYVGYSNGAIMQFNAGNGSLIKSVNEKEVEKDSIQTYVYTHSKEITSLYYYNNGNGDNQHLSLISVSYDSLINVYNETNVEETEKLKTIIGGHTINGKKNEINCLDFSLNLNLYATGSTDGLVVVWDFEMSKMSDIFYLSSQRGEKINTLALRFLDPYPILSATYSDGTLYFWGVKQSKNRGECIFRARNYYKISHRIDVTPINYFITYSDKMDDCKYNVPLLKYFDKDSPFMNPDKEYVPPSPRKKNKKENKHKGELDEEKSNIPSEEEDLNLDIVPSCYKNEIIDNGVDPDLYEQKLTEEDAHPRKHQTLKYYLIVGDTEGNIKLINIIGFIKKEEIEPASKIEIKSTFNLLKKEDVNVEAIINHNLEYKSENSLPKYTNMYYKMIRNEFKAHFEEISCISIIKEPLSFITSSKDKYVKIWNFNCDCLGIINSLPKLVKTECAPIEWKFKVNEEKILENEIAEVVRIFEKVGVEKIQIGSKIDKEVENIKANYKETENVELVKTGVDFVRKKFKYLKKNDSANKNLYKDKQINISYEGFYVQEAQKNIESLINPDYANLGINSIAMKLMDVVVEKGKEKGKKLYKEKEILADYSSTPSEPKLKKKHLTLKRSDSLQKKFIEMNRTTNSLQTNISSSTNDNVNLNNMNNTNSSTNDTNNIFNITYKSNKKSSTASNFFSSSRKNNINSLNNKLPIIKENIEKNLYKQSSKNALNVFANTASPKRMINTFNDNKFNNNKPTKLRQNILKKALDIDDALNNSPSMKKIFKPNKTKSKFADYLFSQKYFGYKRKEGKNKTFDYMKKSKLFNKMKIFDLPLVSDNVIFKKGETEKLLNYNFYTTSYKECCEISSKNGISNTSIKKNYQNNWKIVEDFAREQREKNFLMKEKMNKTYRSFGKGIGIVNYQNKKNV